MRQHHTVLRAVTTALVVVGGFVGAAHAQSEVEAGFDLFESTEDTLFGGFLWEGVPLHTFDFGDGNGPVSVGTTDTIVERLSPANFPGLGLQTVDIELVALQLRSTTPIDLGGGLDFHFITLDDISSSLGEMIITLESLFDGIFDSFIDVDFDIRIGSLTGPIVFSDVLRLSSTGTPWDRTAPPGSILIPGVNDLLNGVDNATDFHPGFIDPITGIKSFTEVHPSGAKHSVQTATPEPGTLALFALGGLMLVRRRR